MSYAIVDVRAGTHLRRSAGVVDPPRRGHRTAALVCPYARTPVVDACVCRILEIVNRPAPFRHRPLVYNRRLSYLRTMKLADYLIHAGITPPELRRRLGISSRSVLSRYLTGERIPNLFMLQKIIDLTEGKVQLRDFLSPGNPRCATVVESPDGRQRLHFPWSTWDRLDPANDAGAEGPGEQGAADDEGDLWTKPVQQAVAVLGARARPGAGGRWFVDGCPTDVRGVVAAANRLLKTWNKRLIAYPGVHSGEDP